MSERSPARRTKHSKGDGAQGEGSSHQVTGSKDLDAALLSKAALARKVGFGLTSDFVVHSMAGDDALRRKALHQHIDELRQNLHQPGDGPLEDLVIERVITSFLAASNAEELRATCLTENLSSDSGRFWDGHVARTNADFLRAAKALALIRRLRLPAVRQLNIGQQQVNVSAETVGHGAGES
jgi:hypothetical protein